MNLLYNAGIKLYKNAACLASLRSQKVSHMLSGQGETMKRLEAFRRNIAPDGFDLWIHAASLGEFEQGRPLIEALLDKQPEAKVLLSFFSPSGYEVRCNFDPRVAVVYLPFDTPSAAEAFIDAASPKKAIFVKYEFWGNYLSLLKSKGIPVYLVSSIFRPLQIFFRPWGGMFRDMLRCFEHIFVQEENSRQLLAGIGITNVTVAGDTRFDRVTAIRRQAHDIPPIAMFRDAVPDAPLLVVGSSWEKDEDIYVDALRQRKELRAIIAPHEFDKNRLAAMRRRFGTDETLTLSDFYRIMDKSPEEAKKTASRLRFLIVDSFGMLSSIYRYATAAYIGGGFGVGIHNINEAAVYGIPVAFGPNNSKFVEASELQNCGGGVCIRSKQEMEAFLDKVVSDKKFLAAGGKAAGDYIASKIGATPVIMRHIFNIDIF